MKKLYEVLLTLLGVLIFFIISFIIFDGDAEKIGSFIVQGAIPILAFYFGWSYFSKRRKKKLIKEKDKEKEEIKEKELKDEKMV